MIWDAMWARIGWYMGELVWLGGLLLLAVAAFLLWGAYVDRKQRRCAHENMRQLPSSPAMKCKDCDMVIWPTEGAQ